MQVIKKHLSDKKWDKAEKLCVENIKNLAGAKSPAKANAFLLLAEIIFGSSDQSDLHLVEKNKKILEATALCHYVLNLCKLGSSSSNVDFSEPEKNATKRIKTLQDALFLSLDIDVAEGQKALDKVKKHQVYLNEIRDGVRDGLKSMPNTSHDDLNEIIEYEHYRKIQELYKVVSEGLVNLVSEMLDDCVTLLGQSPCHYAAIALGSLARLEATPFSDLEWAILIENSDEKHKVYFRKLTQLLHMMVINFGETILPSMGIHCLGPWFYDDVTPRGLAFDGTLPQACKTPLGKRDKDGTIVYELIGSPVEISKFQRLEWLKVNPQLAGVLRTVLVITPGEKAVKLVQDYTVCLREELDELVAQEGDFPPRERKLRETLAVLELARDMDVFNPRLGQEDQAGRFFHVKKEIYRLMDRLVASVGLYFNASGQSAWECLEWLHKENFLSERGLRNLFVAVSIGAELRASAYTMEDRQDDYLDCQAFGDVCENDLDAADRGLGLPPMQTLYRYYFTVLPFLSHILLCTLGASNTSLDQMRDEDFYSDSPKYRALVSMRLRQHERAKIELQKHLIAYPDDLECLTDLGNVLKIFQKFREASLLHYRALNHLLCSGNYVCNGKQLHSLDQVFSWKEFVRPLKSSMNTTLAFHCLRVHLYNLGICYMKMQQNLEAADCLECCVELYREGSGTLDDVHGLARSLNVLACIYNNDGSHKDIECLEEALGLYAKTGSFVTSVAEATTKFNLASRYHSSGQFQRAKTILEETVNQYSYAYGNSDNPTTLRAKILLGEAYLCLQSYHEAVDIFTACIKSLVKPFKHGCSIKRIDVEPFLKIALTGAGLLGLDTFDVTKSDLAEILENSQDKEGVAVPMLFLADYCLRLQKPKPAFALAKKCLNVLRELYGETASHSNLTTNLGILGRSCSAAGKPDMAVVFLKQALENHYEICQKKGQGTDAEKNVEITLLTSLGNVYKAQESVLEALQCYQRCLEIQSAITDDANVVLTLYNLGNTYCLMGILSKGVLFLEMAYDGAKKILTENKPQTVVNAGVLSNMTRSLCTALMKGGQYEKVQEITNESNELMKLVPKTKPLQ